MTTYVPLSPIPTGAIPSYLAIKSPCGSTITSSIVIVIDSVASFPAASLTVSVTVYVPGVVISTSSVSIEFVICITPSMSSSIVK